MQQARNENYAAFKVLPAKLKVYKKHPQALSDPRKVVDDFHDIQTQMGISLDLNSLYQRQLTQLQTQTISEWEEVVSGKYVLDLLRERFPIHYSKEDWEKYILGAYLDVCLEPHPDLLNLINLILDDAGR